VDVALGGLDGLLKPLFAPGSSALTISTPRQVAEDQLRAMAPDALGAAMAAHAHDAATVHDALSAIADRVSRRVATLASHAPCVPALAKVSVRGRVDERERASKSPSPP
jgi:hypothetical protein